MSDSAADRIIKLFPFTGRAHRLLASQIDEEIGVCDLGRTNRLLASLRRARRLKSEVVSEIDGGCRVGRRWWWRV